MARRGPTDAARRRRGGTASSRRRGRPQPPPKKKDDDGFFGNALDWLGGEGDELAPVKFLASPFSPLLHRYGGDIGGKVGTGLTAFGSSPAMIARHPVNTTKSGYSIVTGAPLAAYETAKLLKHEGVGDTASILFHATVADYKTRYGKDWQKHAEKDPLFNFLDFIALTGAGTTAGALGNAAKVLKVAGKPRTLGNVWRESRRPGLISEGATRGRELRYQPPTGEEVMSTQEYARNPFRRGIQKSLDVRAEQFPHAPLVGARARVARANTRGLARTVERTLAKVADPHAVQALTESLKTRLFWAAQLGDHSTAALKEFRDLLEESLNDDDPAKILDTNGDPDFLKVVREARKRGFGKQQIKRLDDAIKAEPNDRYWRAVESMRDMTALSERTIRDADGFTGLLGDLKRGMDRLRGLDPDVADEVDEIPDGDAGWDAYLESLPDDMKQPVRDVMEVRAKLFNMDKRHMEMFRSRRNRLRDWRDQQRVLKSPERIAFLEQMTGLLGEKQATTALAVLDAMANASGDGLDWYRRNVGPRLGQNAGMVMRRTRPGEALFQRRDVLGPIGMEPERLSPTGTPLGPTREPSPFYSSLQEYVLNEMPPGGVQAKQLPGILKSKTRKEEIALTGIEEWAKSFPPEQKIPKQAVIEYLSNPANSLNLEEIHYSSKSGTWKPHWLHIPGLSAVTNPTAEAHQIIFRLPIPIRGQPVYEGKGMMHWGGAGYRGVGPGARRETGKNVVAHLRFHIVTDKQGRKTMVVEEAQSDWLTQWGKQKSFKLTGEQSEWLKRQTELEDVQQQVYRLEDKADDAAADIRDNPGDQEYEDRYHEVVQDYHAARDRMYEVEADFHNDLDRAGIGWEELHSWKSSAEGETPPAPITEEMLWSLSAKRIARFAADNNIDRVVVPDGNVHRFRYGKTDLHKDEEMGAAPTTDAVSMTRALRAETSRHNAPTNIFKRYYDPGSGLNKALQSVLGKEGVWEEKAFLGRYADEAENIQSKQGNMPGTGYSLGSEDWALHRKRPQAFKHQPNWNELPKGALELLGNGEKLLHLFETADVSTPIHELGHIALFDLPEGDLAVIEEIMAGGTKLADWTETQHENFARAFEAYIRRGEAPTPELQAVFKQLAEWMRAIWEMVKGNEEVELDPAVIRVYDNLFKRDPADDVDIFIPHRAGDPDMGGGRTTGGIPRAKRDIGDRTISRIPLFARNRLGLLKMGMLNDDPNMLIEHTNRVVMLARANQLREAVLEMGEPLMPDEIPDFEGRYGPPQYVVKKAGRGVNRPLHDAIEAADDPEEIRGLIKNYVDDYITDDRQKWEAWTGDEQQYVVDKEYVDRLFKNATGKTPGATTKPSTGATKMVDATWDLIRAGLLYLNPGFYVANLLGNSTMMAIADPRSMRHVVSSMREAGRAAHRPDTADPLWRRISVEQGRGPTSGGLSTRPPLLGRGVNWRDLKDPEKLKRVRPAGLAETTSLGIGEYGRRTGRIIDDAMRVAFWKQTASKFGYDTDAKIEKLLDDGSGGKLHEEKRPSSEQARKARRDLAGIRDEAEQLMLDFDSMTPFEKSTLTRIIFLYPFLKASAKWPFMFAGERPVVTGALSEMANVGQQLNEQRLGPAPELPLWMQGAARLEPGKYWAAGSTSPIAPFLGLAESGLGLGQKTETGVSRPIDYLNPGLQMLIELAASRSQFGQDLPAHQILRQDAPMTALQRQLLGLKQPSEIYTDRSKLGTFLRSLRVVPYGVNDGAAPVVAAAPTGRRKPRRRRAASG